MNQQAPMLEELFLSVVFVHRHVKTPLCNLMHKARLRQCCETSRLYQHCPMPPHLPSGHPSSQRAEPSDNQHSPSQIKQHSSHQIGLDYTTHCWAWLLALAAWTGAEGKEERPGSGDAADKGGVVGESGVHMVGQG